MVYAHGATDDAITCVSSAPTSSISSSSRAACVQGLRAGRYGAVYVMLSVGGLLGATSLGPKMRT